MDSNNHKCKLKKYWCLLKKIVTNILPTCFLCSLTNLHVNVTISYKRPKNEHAVKVNYLCKIITQSTDAIFTYNLVSVFRQFEKYLKPLLCANYPQQPKN